MNRTISLALIAIGILVICIGVAYPSLKFVVLVADDTPPYWLIGADGTLALYPKEGDICTNPIGSLQAGVADPESGVTSVTATIDTIQYNVTKVAGHPYSGAIWMFGGVQTTFDPGFHLIQYVAINNVGLKTVYTGTFMIYTAIAGDWYIATGDANWIPVTSINQTVYSKSLTVNFKFIKTSGVYDEKISCSIVEGSTTLLALTYQGSSTWIGSFTFKGGTHILALKAYDGTNSVTMSLVNVDFGGVTISDQQLIIIGIGASFIAVGSYGLAKKRRK